jgi:hypothetical protein
MLMVVGISMLMVVMVSVFVIMVVLSIMVMMGFAMLMVVNFSQVIFALGFVAVCLVMTVLEPIVGVIVVRGDEDGFSVGHRSGTYGYGLQRIGDAGIIGRLITPVIVRQQREPVYGHSGRQKEKEHNRQDLFHLQLSFKAGENCADEFPRIRTFVRIHRQ